MTNAHPFLETHDQEMADLKRDVRRLHDFVRVLAQALRNSGALSESDLEDLRTMCPHTARKVLV